MKLKSILFVLLLVLMASLVSAGTLRVTEEHPFLINGEWIPAKELKIGDRLTEINGKIVEIISIRKVTPKEPFLVYNLEAGIYNNFVVRDTDNLSIVVHNSNNPKILVPKSKMPKGRWIIDSDGQRVFLTDEKLEKPLGFKDWDGYRAVKGPDIKSHVRTLAGDESFQVGIQGSAATGVSSKTGMFVEQPKDFDIIVKSDKVFDTVMSRAENLANAGTLIPGKTVFEQVSYVVNFKTKGYALIHGEVYSRLLPEIPKSKFHSGKYLESGIKINVMVAKPISKPAQRHTIIITGQN